MKTGKLPLNEQAEVAYCQSGAAGPESNLTDRVQVVDRAQVGQSRIAPIRQILWHLAQSLQKVGIRALLGWVLVGLLTACGAGGTGPNRALVKQAIALELSQAQQTLEQQLRLSDRPAKLDIQRVTITEQTPLVIDQLQAFRVRGTYDYRAQFSKRQVTKRQNPFEVYLQRQKEGKTWRLARLQPDQTGETVWVTQSLPSDS